MPRKATSHPKPAADARKTRGARLRTHVRVMLEDEIALGPGKTDLLEAIRDTGSISAGGKQLGMSYRRAWLLVDAMNRCFKAPLVTTSAGGVAGGGARLTATGADVLQRYRALEKAVAAATETGFNDLRPYLRKTPQPPA